MSDRLQAIEQWLREDVGLRVESVEPASEDASFRSYLRVRLPDGETRIVMDAPPEKETLEPFVDVAERLKAAGLNVPEVHARDPEQGLLLLTDLGEQLYLDALNAESVERLYGDAMGALAALQVCGPREGDLPDYDEAKLREELELFPEWFLKGHLGVELNDSERGDLEAVFATLLESALEQPRAAVHRDYHSRNLLVSEHNPGIIDFQDAVIGPVTYDLVSLLRDVYIAWPREQVEDWALGYMDLAIQSGILKEEDLVPSGQTEGRIRAMEQGFLRWFDLMGVQRHLKVAGIFARLNHRDGKAHYLNDIPLTLEYLEAVAARYRELEGLHALLRDKVLPAARQRQAG